MKIHFQTPRNDKITKFPAPKIHRLAVPVRCRDSTFCCARFVATIAIIRSKRQLILENFLRRQPVESSPPSWWLTIFSPIAVLATILPRSSERVCRRPRTPSRCDPRAKIGQYENHDWRSVATWFPDPMTSPSRLARPRLDKPLFHGLVSPRSCDSRMEELGAMASTKFRHRFRSLRSC